jgi:hypothetical protein
LTLVDEAKQVKLVNVGSTLPTIHPVRTQDLSEMAAKELGLKAWASN